MIPARRHRSAPEARSDGIVEGFVIVVVFLAIGAILFTATERSFDPSDAPAATGGIGP